MGGCCQLCGYNRCPSALDLHHLAKKEKDFTFGHVTSNPKKWAVIVEELKKCILLCKNCHTEVHAGLITQVFQPSYSEQRAAEFAEDDNYDFCICGNQKLKARKFCSRSCAGKNSWRTNWGDVDLIKLLTENDGNFSAVARLLDLSDAAIRKRFNRLTNCKSWKDYIRM